MKYVITINAPNSEVDGHVMCQLAAHAFRTESTLREDYTLDGIRVETVEVVTED